MRSQLPSWNAVMKACVATGPGGGTTSKPSAAMTDATRHPPFSAYPTICGARTRPAAAQSSQSLRLQGPGSRVQTPLQSPHAH